MSIQEELSSENQEPIFTKPRRCELHAALIEIDIPAALSGKKALDHVKDTVTDRLANKYNWPGRLIEPIIQNIERLVHIDRRSTKVTPGFKDTLVELF